MSKYVIATVDEVPPGERKIVEIDGRSVGVFNVKGEFFALLNRCPHQGGVLCKGILSGFLEARVPGEYRYSRRGEIIRCPWHGWEFDVKTGQSWFDPAKKRVRSYEVSLATGPDLDDDAVMLAAGLQKGPYSAETYPVSVEQQFVVVEIP